MAVTLFKDTTYNLTGLVEHIRRGEIGLPDIQRPFVWANTKVRDLFDSMYKGFPVGYLLFWATGAEAGARQIGTEAKETVQTAGGRESEPNRSARRIGRNTGGRHDGESRSGPQEAPERGGDRGRHGWRNRWLADVPSALS